MVRCHHSGNLGLFSDLLPAASLQGCGRNSRMLPFLTRTPVLGWGHLIISSKPVNSLKISPTAVPWRVWPQRVFAKEGTWHPIHRAGQRDSGLAHCFDGHLGSLVVASEPCSLLSTYYVSGSVVSTLQCEPTQPSRPPSLCMQALLAPFYRREHGLSWRGRSSVLLPCEFLETGTLV